MSLTPSKKSLHVLALLVKSASKRRTVMELAQAADCSVRQASARLTALQRVELVRPCHLTGEMGEWEPTDRGIGVVYGIDLVRGWEEGRGEEEDIPVAVTGAITLVQRMSELLSVHGVEHNPCEPTDLLFGRIVKKMGEYAEAVTEEYARVVEVQRQAGAEAKALRARLEQLLESYEKVEDAQADTEDEDEVGRIAVVLHRMESELDGSVLSMQPVKRAHELLAVMGVEGGAIDHRLAVLIRRWLDFVGSATWRTR
jgi:hypothetical protein